MPDKLIITAALAGSATTRAQNPAVPYTPDEFAAEARKCQDEGAAIVHLHARDPETGARTFQLAHFRDVCDAVRARCPGLIINLTTTSRSQDPPESRFERIAALRPEMASLDTNSMNFAQVDRKTGEIRSEFLFENTFATIIRLARLMREHGSKPECEVFDFGGLYNVLLIRKQGIFVEPMHFQFVFGVAGGIPYDPSHLARLRDLLPERATWSVCGVGRDQFRAGMTAAVNDGHIRVGLEDNTRMPNGELAKGSWEQVRWAAEVARLAGRDVASPNEARQLLHLSAR